jgi:crotonobetainyl-CoA:carnitine CoA-transferase CaiB-like acyl-CoA transferase
MSAGILDGVTVLDFGRYIAGPLACAMLGDLGADVIRVERIGGAEDRQLYPVTDGGEGALFLQVNRNKRSLAIDVKSPEGQEIIKRLVRKSGIVIANLPESGLKELSIDFDSLKAIRDDVILVAVSAFGPTGPYADKVGFDGVGQAMSGAVHLSGFQQPTKSFASWVDFTTAQLAAFGALAAIHERSRSGRGQRVDTSLFGAALTVMNFPLIEQALTGADRERSGNRGQSGAPADIFQTRDGWVAIQVLGDAIFRRWCRLMGEAHWLTDARFQTDGARSENAAELCERTALWCASLTTQGALEQLSRARIPAGPVLSPREALSNPQVVDGGLLESIDYPGLAGPIPLVIGLRLSETATQIRRRPPLAGEHNDELLNEIGVTRPPH